MKKEVLSLLQTIGQVLVGAVTDQTLLATKDIITDRLTTCGNCVELELSSLACKQCGCKVAYKARLKHATCPRGKWK